LPFVASSSKFQPASVKVDWVNPESATDLRSAKSAIKKGLDSVPAPASVPLVANKLLALNETANKQTRNCFQQCYQQHIQHVGLFADSSNWKYFVIKENSLH